MTGFLELLSFEIKAQTIDVGSALRQVGRAFLCLVGRLHLAFQVVGV